MKFKILTIISFCIVGSTFIINCSNDKPKQKDPFAGCICNQQTGRWEQNYADTKNVCDMRLAKTYCGGNMPVVKPTVYSSPQAKAVDEGKKGTLEKGAETLKNAETGINEAKKLIGTKEVEIKKK